jgi:glycosyltransferase involved in cell wall biosynthesis
MLTVIITTYNGERTLPRVLEGYTRLLAPSGGWKLIVSDNGSKDGTREIIERFKDRLPLTYIFEAQRGQNAARNPALLQLEGDLVVFSDDDATPEPGWLSVLRDVADEHQDYDFFGGAIVPEWERPPEPWILEQVDHGVCFSITDPAQPEGPVAPNLVWGPNMAFRRRIFELGYRFDPTVGPSGSSYAMGAETDFTVRLGDAGFKAWFCPDAIVRHFIRAHQFDRKWILGRAVRFGRGMYRRQLLRQPEAPRLLFGVPRYLYRKIASQALAYARAAMFGRPESFRERWELNYLLGCAIQARKHFRGPNSRHSVPAARSRI